MLIAVRNITLTCELHKAIKLIYKNTHTRVIVVLRLPGTLRRPRLIVYCVTSELLYADIITMSRCRAGALDKYDIMDGVQYVDTTEAHTIRLPLTP